MVRPLRGGWGESSMPAPRCWIGLSAGIMDRGLCRRRGLGELFVFSANSPAEQRSFEKVSSGPQAETGKADTDISLDAADRSIADRFARSCAGNPLARIIHSSMEA